MDNAKDVFKAAIEHIYLVLKYMASGFVAVAVYVFLHYGPSLIPLAEKPVLIAFLSISIGLLTYAFHFALLDNAFYGLFAKQCWNKDQIENAPDVILNDLKIQINKGVKVDPAITLDPCDVSRDSLKFVLASQTYLRSCSTDKKVVAIQEQMNIRLAFLNFLYCSSYQMLTILLYFVLQKILCKTTNLIDLCAKFSEHGPAILNIATVGIGGIAFLICAFIFNKRICKREIWAIYKFPQRYEATELVDDRSLSWLDKFWGYFPKK